MTVMYRKVTIKRIFLSFFGHLFSQEKAILIYHPIQTDKSVKIIPWYEDNKCRSNNHAIYLVWNLWDHIRQHLNDLHYYTNHQVQNAKVDDQRGIGGVQFAIVLSS
jgi:hypothetical protein